MLRSISACVFVLVAAVFVSIVLVASPVEAADADQVQSWIAELDAEKFDVREAATGKLIKADYAGAIDDVARTVEDGSAEARERALHILSVWHKENTNARSKVTATAKRWQETKDPAMVRLGKELVAKVTPKPVQQYSPNGLWTSAVILDGRAMPLAVPVGGRAIRIEAAPAVRIRTR